MERIKPNQHLVYIKEIRDENRELEFLNLLLIDLNFTSKFHKIINFLFIIFLNFLFSPF